MFVEYIVWVCAGVEGIGDRVWGREGGREGMDGKGKGMDGWRGEEITKQIHRDGMNKYVSHIRYIIATIDLSHWMYGF